MLSGLSYEIMSERTVVIKILTPPQRIILHKSALFGRLWLCLSLLLLLLTFTPSLAYTEDVPQDDTVLYNIMAADRDKFGNILDNAEKYEVQILFTEIIRDENNHPTFIQHEYNLDANRYFAPASAVKMVIAALTLQKLNQLDIEGVDRDCTLTFTQVNWWDTAESGRTVATYVRRVLQNSDNNCYNRLYEFLGTEYINETLRGMGYTHVQLNRRYNMQTSARQDSITGPVKVIKNGKVLYSEPTRQSSIQYTLENSGMEGLLRGDRYYSSRGIVQGPKSFYEWNFLSVETLQGVLKAIAFPDSVEPRYRFDLSESDRLYLMEWLLGTSSSSRKYLYYGAKSGEVDPHIKIYNKTGTAYGNLLDNAYIVDTKNNIEFMLTAVIYVNENGTIGDDTYAYKTIGMPFLKNIGQAVHGYLLEKKTAQDNYPQQ